MTAGVHVTQRRRYVARSHGVKLATQREAREHAERWLQALRTWRVSEGDRVPYSVGPSRASRMRVVGVGSMGMGSSGSTWITITLLDTPIGQVEERRVGQLCSMDPYLSEVRRGAGLATLMHSSGRGWAGERARAYARALLRLAADLGDSQAVIYQHQLSNAED